MISARFVPRKLAKGLFADKLTRRLTLILISGFGLYSVFVRYMNQALVHLGCREVYDQKYL